MGTLSTFLRGEAARLRAEKPTREAKIQDWYRAVNDLFGQLQEWVRQADTEGVIELEVGESPFELIEEGLGEYELPVLRIQLDTRKIFVIGKARNVVDRIHPPGTTQPRQADGLLVISDSLLADRLARYSSPVYYLYRLAEPDGDHWYIRHPVEDQVQRLDRERFEAVLVSLLKCVPSKTRGSGIRGRFGN